MTTTSRPTLLLTIAFATLTLSTCMARAEPGDKYEMLQNEASKYIGRSRHVSHETIIGGRPAECIKFPATRGLYCGCASALYIGLKNITGHWNVARHWFAFPRSSPGPGKAIVRRNHVAIIEGGRPGAWRIYDPNSGGGLTRIYVTAQLRGVVVDPQARAR